MTDRSPVPAVRGSRTGARVGARIGLRTGALALAAAFALSVLLALPRLDRHDFAHTPRWRTDATGAYYYGAGPLPGPVDAEGVRVVDLGPPLGRRHSPTAVAQYAISLSERLDDAAAARAFWTQARWLRDHAARDAVHGVRWLHDYDWSNNQQHAPWISAQTQGNAISVMVRAWRLSGDTSYLALARGALRAFDLDERAGGVAFEPAPGLVIYQDFPSCLYVVVDGWLNGLTGVQELYLATGDTAARRLLDRGVRSAAAILPEFTGALGTYYSSRRDLPSPTYFSFAYNSLRVLAEHHPSLRPVEARWSEFLPSGFWVKYARVYYQALNWRLLMLRGVPPLDVGAPAGSAAERRAGGEVEPEAERVSLEVPRDLVHAGDAGA